jgi:hypothetical protein
MADLSLLAFNGETGAYTPHDKAWIKDEVQMYLVEQSQQ